MKLLYSFGFLLFCFTAYSQKILKGVVLDAEKNTPIPNASVFLNTTSIGTTTNEQGGFTLSLPVGKYDLIISSIGYQTHNQTINPNEAPDFLTIKLQVKSQLMQTVIIEPYEKDGWKKWGRFFLDNFIGTTTNAQECKIKNANVIRFRNSKKTNELSAFADEPLVIENKALGYTIRYQLETFTYNFKNSYLLYVGYPFFQPMRGNATRQRRWQKRRSEAYFGSVMHFMRSVYRNSLLEESYELREVQKIPNAEKQRVKAFYSCNSNALKTTNRIIGITVTDSTAYYDRILRQKDFIDVVGRNILTGDSIAFAVDSTTAGMYFKNYLLVIYRNNSYLPTTGLQSQIFLINEKPILIEANGSYFDPQNLLTTGYWAWSEKIANLLPFDYVPPKQ